MGQTARQAFSDLDKITSHAKKFGISLPIVINTSMVDHFQHFSGLIFYFVAADSRKRKRGGVNILSAGGTYDKLIRQFRRVAATSHISHCGVGVSIAIEETFSALVEDQEALLPFQYDVFVCSTGPKSMQKESMQFARDLWNAGINCNAKISYGAMSLGDAQSVWIKEEIQHMVVFKDQDPAESVEYFVKGSVLISVTKSPNFSGMF